MVNKTFGGLKGKSFGNSTERLKTPPSYGDSSGPGIVATHLNISLSSFGPAEYPSSNSALLISSNSFLIRLRACAIFNYILLSNT